VAVVACVLGATMLLTACSSPSPSPRRSQPPGQFPTNAAFTPGPDPCLLLTSRDVSTAMNELMVIGSKSKWTCTYVNAKTGDTVSISTAVTTPEKAGQAVTSAANAAKGQVVHLNEAGSSAVVSEKTTATGTIATSVLAKNGTVVIIFVGGKNATSLFLEVTALTKTVSARV